MNAEEWFSQMLAESRNHPDFVAETVSLQIISDLCKAMKRKQITKKELAERVGVSPAFVSQVLNSKPNMTLLTLAKFAIALDLDVHIHLSPRPEEIETEAVAQQAVPQQRGRQAQPRTPPRRSRRTAATPV
jgi:transcriptional regulator with XRE-family HTH domain